MTTDEYYAILKERWEQTDQTSRAAIHEYNEWKRRLRQTIDDNARKPTETAFSATPAQDYAQ